MPAATRPCRGTLTMIFMPIMWSVYGQRADAIVAAQPAGVLRGE